MKTTYFVSMVIKTDAEITPIELVECVEKRILSNYSRDVLTTADVNVSKSVLVQYDDN